MKRTYYCTDKNRTPRVSLQGIWIVKCGNWEEMKLNQQGKLNEEL